MKIAICAGEASGDSIAASLMQTIRLNYPDAEFFGMAGPKMAALGCRQIVSSDAANVMGFFHVIKKLPKILKISNALINACKKEKPELFIGVDFTDFNIRLAGKLKKLGIKTVQYKGPSVWAWRPSRAKKVARNVDLLLTIFPFEEDAYSLVDIKTCYVGHPLANEIPLKVDVYQARKMLDLSPDTKILAVLPGSREQEIKSLSPIYYKALVLLSKKRPDICFIVAHLNAKTKLIFEEAVDNSDDGLKIHHKIGQTRDVLAASSAVLVTSGTATFETMLYKKPMVIAYKVSYILGKILKRLISADFIGLPNLIANEEIVPELKQNDVNPNRIFKELEKSLFDESYILKTENSFLQLHQMLRADNTDLLLGKIEEVLKND